MLRLSHLSTRDADFDARLARLLAFENTQDESIDQAVAAILADVKLRGDDALFDHAPA